MEPACTFWADAPQMLEHLKMQLENQLQHEARARAAGYITAALHPFIAEHWGEASTLMKNLVSETGARQLDHLRTRAENLLRHAARGQRSRPHHHCAAPFGCRQPG